MKKSFLLMCASLVLLFASCSKKYDPVPDVIGEVQIRAVNTFIGSVSQDLLINNTPQLTALSYGNVSSYITASSAPMLIGFYDTRTTTTMNAGGQVSIPVNAKVSIYYLKTPEGVPGAILLNDATTAPASGKAKVRFFNLNNALNGNISVTIDGPNTTLVPAVKYSECSLFFEVDPGTKFNFVGNGVVPTPAFDGALAAGKVYTIWIDGPLATNLNGHLVVNN